MSDKSWGVGEGLKTSYPNQVLLGRYNGEPPEGTLLALGNGTADNARNTALLINESGEFCGDVNIIGDVLSQDLFAEIGVIAGTCDTEADVRNKRITASGFEFDDGNYLVVTFTNPQTYSGSIRFIISLSQIDVYYNGSPITNTNGAWGANETLVFKYVIDTSSRRFERIDSGANDAQLLKEIKSLGWDDDCLLITEE